MNTDSTSKLWNDLFIISQMMVQMATTEYSEDLPNEDGVHQGLPDKGLIIPKSGDSPQPVQKDGPKGKSNAKTVPPAISLRTLGGELFVFDHGKMIQKGLFEYRHIAPDLMTSVLRIGPSDEPSLAPDENDYPGTKLTKEEKKSTPTSESALLKSVKFGQTLALEYSDDPANPHAQLVTLPEPELMSTLKKIEQKQDLIFKVNPVIKIRSSTPSPRTNNIALYFITSRFYYYIYVNNETNPPKLELKCVEKTPEFDPHKDYIRHLQFKEKPIISHPQDETDGNSLNSIPEKNEDKNSDHSDPEDSSKIKDFLERSNSERSGSASKPASLDLRILIDPSIVRDKATDEDETASNSPESGDGEDKAMPEKQTSTGDSSTNNDLSHQNGDSPASNNMSKTDLSSEVDATVE